MDWCELKPLVEKNILSIRGDGMLERTGHPSDSSPWHHVVPAQNKDCGIWHEIVAHIKQFVPSKCQECWKVVVRPQTLRELFQLLEIQKELQMPSKCGIEERPIVHGLYGGYFYNDSLEEGLECYEKVCDAVDMPISLKRGCTEFELACGNSRTWEVTDSQLGFEDMVDRCVVKYPEDHARQSFHAIQGVHRSWIEWAYAHGDKTYLEYTDGWPLYTPPATYHSEETCRSTRTAASLVV